ncbi:TRAP transporter small permease [Peptoniphilus raoultii]|uniref:TRAP transporter small permease n=1 Tax=Peptoniphilus raoultii TaxID=1776387 RepID=UPI0009F73AB3|nr:TRAP transporter small permease [Peptoniphilus raoultii]
MLKVKNIFLNILKAACLICIIGLTVVVAIQVITRTLKLSFPWCEELARFFLIWLTFCGCSVALAEDRHLSVNFFVNLTKGKVNKAIGFFGKLIIIIFYGIIAFYGMTLSMKTIKVLSPTMQWSMGLVYSVLPITSFMTIYILLVMLFEKKGEEN